MRKFRWFLLFGLAAIVGCKTGTLPDPNDPKQAGSLTSENIIGLTSSISDSLQSKVAIGIITDDQAKVLLQQEADSLLVGFSPDKTDVTKLWQIGNVMITAKHWKDAKPVMEAAVEFAKLKHNEDRRINDSLKLARVQAELGDVSEAIKIARTVFDAAPTQAVPILYGTLSEIVPAGRGKGHDLELAKLLEDAIGTALKAEVNPNSGAGRLYLLARPHKIQEAWKLIEDLYEDAKRPDLAVQARTKEVQMAESMRPGHPTQI